MSDTMLSTRTRVALAATAIACLVLLAHMGNGEPALPNCAARMPARIECRP